MKWYARTGNILQMGPFNSQKEAWASCLLVDYHPEYPYYSNTFIYPDPMDVKKKNKYEKTYKK